MKISTRPGKHFPLGATWDGEGVNFALYANHADKVELCLFNDQKDEKASACIDIKDRFDGTWHIYIHRLMPGQLYGYRVHGKYDPSAGHRHNASKLLIDPYAKAIAGSIEWNDALFGYEVGARKEDLQPSNVDNTLYIPKSVVIDNQFNWGRDIRPDISYHQTIIYEAHVRGLTKLHPHIPETLRGTYAGLAHPVMINYFKQLGITTIELLPVHHFIRDRHLEEKGLTNFWGYNTIGFFAPEVRYSSSGVLGEQVKEFKTMVKEFHKAGIEVILDVVYNHTAEGNHLGPTLSFRGIDNLSYYNLVDDDKRYYDDYTGTGNTMNACHPNVLKLIMDSLRYWIQEMHVDGFRFDLAATLVRELKEAGQLNAFFDIIHQDPVISQVKLIAEPWDISETGYLLGKFPPDWAEWNDKYRDCMRDYWRGTGCNLSEFANRFTGSPDLYESTNRQPTASINFITAHDGFTMRDLVSYNEKHNEGNKDNNKDGSDNNHSWNCGAEGPTNDEAIIQLRRQQQRNFFATLLLSQGVPMILSGDEIGNTQYGNNNSYCQDNEISWINWKEADVELLNFVKRLITLRKEHPMISRKRWFRGRALTGGGTEETVWFMPNGSAITGNDWNNGQAKSLGVYLRGLEALNDETQDEKTREDIFFLIVNAEPEPVEFALPDATWKKVVDTGELVIRKQGKIYKAGQKIVAEGRSAILLQKG